MSKYSSHQYYLNIHHRSMAVSNGADGKTIEVSVSPGHFFVSLQMNEERKYFGKYAKGETLISQIYGKGEILSEREKDYVGHLTKLAEQTGEEYHYFKSIKLTEEQYDAAFKFASSKVVEVDTFKTDASKAENSVEPESYILGFNDCTDFVQAVYHHAGLPLYFTIAFTRMELLTMGTLAASNVIYKYGASDRMDVVLSSIKAVNKASLAKSLNIDVDSICYNEPTAHANEDLSGIPNFKVLLDKVKLPEVTNVDSDLIEIKGSKHDASIAQDPFDFTQMLGVLPLPAEQREQAARDASDFFNGMIQNPYMMDPSNFALAPQILFPEIDDETKQWAEDLAANSEVMLSSMGFGNSSNDIFGQGAANQFYDFDLD